MKTKLPLNSPTTLLIFLLSTINYPLSTRGQGTAFTYQGRLNDGAYPANGTYDLRFAIYDALANGNAIANPVTNAAVPVAGGLFNTTLDFGSVFTGTNYWLEIAVRTNAGGAFSALTPRQQLTPTPYAIMANSAGNLLGVLPAGQLSGPLPATQLSGTIALAQLPGAVLTNGESGVSLDGTFSGNGAGVTNVSLAALNSFGSIFWGNFTIASSPGVGATPSSVVAADVNGDGKLDLISANYNDNTLTVLTNNGSGGFVLSSSPGVGSHP